ncbi:N-acetylmuramidase family protein [Vibrio sp. SM6]|uniref:N-acetylmuramidase family protein n=1 Tax=Vibrio agarilyticus TaxID=2726741 RepID=A0A7X8TPQ4_9VIBR|nr:N-acetylmuramidase family protein [Vibrio agarilyticus]NLS11953.1 N-acetylmuramidase family protein [Vibrio agarilyticus]
MKSIHMNRAVGAGAPNQYDDVLAVQKALNQLSDKIGLTQPLSEDGVIITPPNQSPTCIAIGRFQSRLLGFNNPDYRIDEGGRSHRGLAKACSNAISPILGLFLPRIKPTTGLSDSDFLRAAERLECEVAAIKAVSEVESKGSGFFANGAPAILFEAHIFSKYSDSRFDESHPSLSSKKWDRSLYQGGEQEYQRLQQAMMLDRHAALMSASYGRYQIMGFNHHAAGYDDIEDFVHDMFVAESHHLDAFVGFILSNSRLHQAIQSLDWATFARHYNGPGYAENHYDAKLKAAYDAAS